MKSDNNFNASLIAPCGMNCALCLAHLRDKNKCPGCRSEDEAKPLYCFSCKIRNCTLLQKTTSHFCYDCYSYPENG